MLPRVNTLRDQIVVIDTETGGLDPLTHSILSIGLVDWTGAHRVEIFVREPELCTNPRSMAVNGIDLGWIEANGCTPAEACDRIDAWLAALPHAPQVMVAGHNVAFDLSFLRRLYALAGRAVPACFCHRSLDTHTLLYVLALQGKLPSDARSSDGAFAHFDVAPPEALRHTALGDAVATRDLLEHLLALCD